MSCKLVDRYSAGQTFQFVALHGVMNLLESGVFQRVHEHDLAFHVLDDLEKKGKLVVFSKIRTLAGEKITDNLNRVRAGGEPFAAGFFQQWEQDAGLLYGIKRQSKKQPVVKLIIQLHEVPVIVAD